MATYRCKPDRVRYALSGWPSVLFGALALPVGVYIAFAPVVPVSWLLLWPLPAIALWYLMAPLRFWLRAKHIEYVVREGRAQVLHKGRIVRDYAAADIELGKVFWRSDGSGSLRVAKDSGDQVRSGGFQEATDAGFFGVEDIQALAEAIRREQPAELRASNWRGARSPASSRQP